MKTRNLVSVLKKIFGNGIALAEFSRIARKKAKACMHSARITLPKVDGAIREG